MTSIAAAFRAVAAAHAGVPALTSATESHTYRDLDTWSDAVAAMLVERAAALSRPVALVMRDPVALVVATLGAIKAGHFFVAIDAAERADRIDTILTRSDASVTVSDHDVRVLRLRSEPQSPGDRQPHELIQLVYTSGTTGTPKAVASPQRGFVERVTSQAALTGRQAGARVSYTALPGFARATAEILGSLLSGATLCAWDARRETFEALSALIARERISTLTLTPALFRRFMTVLPPDVDLSSVTKLRIGADVMTVADVDAYKRRFPRTCTLERAFNATETGLVMHMTITHDTPIDGPLVPIGRPRPDVTVRLVDEHGRDVPDGEPGEMVVTSPHVADGYWNDPELSATKFRTDPQTPGLRTYFTGDLVERDANGLHYFVGRTDSRLKIHGRRIDPLEVESALLAHARVREAVAVGKIDERGEQHLVAYVVMSDDEECNPRVMRAALRAVVPPHLIPTQIHAVAEIPMTSAGKVDRTALRNRVDTVISADSGDDLSDELERSLTAVWSRVLGRPVRLDDDFFDDLGGESVVAAHLVAEVQRLLGRTLPLSILLELNTVAKMADYLRTRTDRERLAVVVQRGTGARPPLFCVSGKGGSVILFRGLAEALGRDQSVIGLTHDGFLPETFPRTFPAMATCYVDAIRAIQPHGPYAVAGYSAGGFVALDIARQLALSGEAVNFVGMIDTAHEVVLASRWRRLRKHLTLLRKHPRANTPRYAAALGRRVMRIVRWLGGRGWSLYAEPPIVPPLQSAYMAIRKRDTVRPYDGKVTLFLATHGWGTDALHRDLGWSRYCPALEIIDVDGEHHTVLHDDVRSLGAAVRRSLDACSWVPPDYAAG